MFIIKLARGSLMLITPRQLDTFHYKVDTGDNGGWGSGRTSTVSWLGTVPHVHIIFGPNRSLGLWRCAAGLQEIIFLS